MKAYRISMRGYGYKVNQNGIEEIEISRYTDCSVWDLRNNKSARFSTYAKYYIDRDEAVKYYTSNATDQIQEMEISIGNYKSVLKKLI